MIVQEAGVGMGWPLGLGHDTTGWPLGLRLRLTQEDLQYPREIDLTSSPSCTTDDSSSLDTTSTRSFFQDKSVTLGTLIGLPILDRQPQQHHPPDGNNRQSRQAVPGNTENTSASLGLPRSNERLSSRSRRTCRKKSSYSARKQQIPPSGRGPSTPAYPVSASGAGWNCLSVLSCARVPAQIGPVPSDMSTSGPPCAPQAVGEVERVRLNERDHESAVVSSGLQLSFHGSKLYDNITFEDVQEEQTDHPGSDQDGPRSSKECNPLFVSSPSPHHIDDEEDYELRTSGANESLNHMQSGTPSRLESSEETLSIGNPLTTAGSASSQILRIEKALHVRNGFPRTPNSLADRKTKAVSIFVSRMVCCRNALARNISFRV